MNGQGMVREAGVNERVYIAVNDSPAKVFHTRRECPMMPQRYELLAKADARSDGYRLCSRCEEARYDVLEL